MASASNMTSAGNIASAALPAAEKEKRPRALASLPKEKKAKKKKAKRVPGAPHNYQDGVVLDEGASLHQILLKLDQHCAVTLPFTPTEGNLWEPERWTSGSTLYNPLFIAEMERALN